MIDFFSMGGYAVYVWPSFVLTAIVMFANFYLALRRRKKVIAELRRTAPGGKPSTARLTVIWLIDFRYIRILSNAS